MPDPAPWSGNANVADIWKGNNVSNTREDTLDSSVGIAMPGPGINSDPMQNVVAPTDMKTDDTLSVGELIDVSAPPAPNSMTNSLVDIVPDTNGNPVVTGAPIAGSPIKDVQVNNQKPEEKTFVDLGGFSNNEVKDDDILIDEDDGVSGFDPVDFS